MSETSHPRPRNRRSDHRRRNLDSKLQARRTQCLEALQTTTLYDAAKLRNRVNKARTAQAFTSLERDIRVAQQRYTTRIEHLPIPDYPANLPVSERKDDIVAAIQANQVVIIAGETGSGKTTQIPKICLELGRGRRGLIGHTQPRRLAARTVAERIAEELQQPVGESVGYAIRFDDQVSDTTAIKLMTDGILLSEMQRDRLLLRYDTIIIDEAHERSLNIDFLLGYLKQILPKRPDLKVIITSATIDPERFAQHFASPSGTPAPIIEVSGRTFPVEILYRPLERTVGDTTVDIDPVDGLLEALEELMGYGDGDILCFFAGEADIREAMEAIEAKHWRGIEVVPLFGRLSNQEQHRVFQPHSLRRIVLSTNIAETSLTVPGIHFVVDAGTARISRYSVRTKVQRLPIEPISQASAAQRSGRCGRVADGVAIRLYSEQDFDSRPAFTDPEILRTNLAQVILQMAALQLGDIEDFPFLQAPDTKAIRDGMVLLHELGALEQLETRAHTPRLTRIGRDIAKIPLDPRMSRMLVAANELGCLHEMQVIVAALSIQDVRERPLEFQAQADQLHARFKDPTSDFLSYLKLWHYITTTRQQLSSNAFKKQMQREYLHYMRIREWFDLVRQLKSISEQLSWSTQQGYALDPIVPSQPRATRHTNDDDGLNFALETDQATAIHQSLITGLLSHIGIRIGQTKEYQGARNTRFYIFPGSSVAKTSPQFIIASELVETSRLFGRDVASIDPIWVERCAQGLLKHQYSEPHWSSKKATAMVYQRSTLYGVPIVADRLVAYQRIDAPAAREMFIREALIAGQWTTHHKFFHRNVEKLQEAMELEHRARRRDIVVDEETLFAFYDARLPVSVTSGRNFDHWWKRQQQRNRTLLDFDPEHLVNDQASVVTEEAFPTTWHSKTLSFELSYQFEPGTEFDGVTIHIPIPILAGLDDTEYHWLVPGMREELVTELIRGLPKHVRRQVVPAPEYAKKVLPLLRPHAPETLYQQLATILQQFGGVGIDAGDFQPAKLPAHLRMTFAAIDKRGKILDHDKSLIQLKQRKQQQIRASVAKVTQVVEQHTTGPWTAETLGTIESEVTTIVDGQQVTTYPALVKTAKGLAIKAMGTQAEADAAMLTTTLTLLLETISVNTQKMLNGLSLQQRVGIENYPHGGAHGFVEEARIAAIRDLMMEAGGPVRDPAKFQKLLETVRSQTPTKVRTFVTTLAPALVLYLQTADQVATRNGPAWDDMREQLAFLLPRHALVRHGMARLQHLPRYIQAMHIRIEELGYSTTKDLQRMDSIHAVEDRLFDKLALLPTGREKTTEVKNIQWLIQELRVSTFAQRLGTSQKVSESKINKLIQQLR
ncbi:ATP-dependent RNA helicase HrpA [Corynebacterium sp. HS2168-gen11]|uniref:ATP-dependent RNA helicase HrpA n=1 Tax=Corynebacterium sp. HS2168-gen11 TaxID=2974027 RepID=UPI00216AC3C4|nr:ATP-dependent RNA helicase HrpA [Corynebacterium sp. HS2168-gen11]MCS4535243.1 ATP-dependent RNA helicase HrpA [Corynebacterium sp. HS2168-gen11]